MNKTPYTPAPAEGWEEPRRAVTLDHEHRSIKGLEEKHVQLPIGTEEIRKAMDRLKKYQYAKATLDNRIVANEEWWKLRHWQQLRAEMGKSNRETVEPTSAWLLNCVLNKHADAMDNYPTINVLPRERGDMELAETLSSVVPVVLEENHYEEVYNDKWWYKIKHGTGVEMVYWDAKAHNGLGEIGICTVDLLRLAWEPGVRNIQDSEDVFCLDVMPLERFKACYPEAADEVTGGTGLTVVDYHHDDNRDTSDMVVVVDWYYKRVDEKGKTVLHLAKFVDETLLFASENEPEFRESGFYEHGEYPFVFDALFPVQDSCTGMGHIDIGRDPQMYVDKLDSLILTNAIRCGKKRYMIADNSGVNEEEFADWDKDFVHVQGTLSDALIREIDVSALDAKVYDTRQTKIDELKETSGNRDFNQGGTTSGVTAASAIAALQESGNKLSRDMVKAGYRAYEKVCALVVELIRQFYTAPRTFRITGKDGGMDFVTLDSSMMQPEVVDEMGVSSVRKPVFDLKIKAQRENPFARLSQNELAVQLYQMGVFNPEMADQAVLMLDMMQFEGVEALKRRLQERGNVFGMMQQQIGMLQQQLAALTGAMQPPAAPPEPAMPPQAQGLDNPVARAAQTAQKMREGEAARRVAERGA